MRRSGLFRMRPRAAAARLALAGALLLGGCRSWETARDDFVEPFNRWLHKQYPQAIASRDVESVLGFYAPALAADPGFRKGVEDLLGRFEKVDYSDDVLLHLTPLAGDHRLQVRLFLRVRGYAPDGRRLSLERELDLVCQKTPEGYRIVEEKLTADRPLYATGPPFTEEAEARGLVFQHRSGGVKDRWGRVQSYAAGAGLGAGDYDGDGWEDLCFVGGHSLSLFHNKGQGRFEDATAAAGLSAPIEGEGRLAVFGDYDGDGRDDLFIGVIDAPNLLLHQEEGGRFADSAGAAGLRPTLETTGACFADFDRDGYLDLFIANGGNLLRKDPDPVYAALNAAPKVLYMNAGGSSFRDKTREAGVGHTGWALSVAVQDYDLDGDDDIFIGNDVGFSVLYRNRGDATFDDVSYESGIVRRGTGMGGSWGDPDGDGRPDLFVSGMFSNSRWIVDLKEYPAPAPWYVNLLFERTVRDMVKEMFGGNWHYRQLGPGAFQESAAPCGIQKSGWAWSSAFLDYDNDGREDLYVLNGFISGRDHKDL